MCSCGIQALSGSGVLVCAAWVSNSMPCCLTYLLSLMQLDGVSLHPVRIIPRAIEIIVLYSYFSCSFVSYRFLKPEASVFATVQHSIVVILGLN